MRLQMGAVCHAKVNDDITHVVSTAQDTDKMHWAKRHSKHMVSPNWVFVSGKFLLLYAVQTSTPHYGKLEKTAVFGRERV